jgi:hypothetical protein
VATKLSCKPPYSYKQTSALVRRCGYRPESVVLIYVSSLSLLCASAVSFRGKSHWASSAFAGDIWSCSTNETVGLPPWLAPNQSWQEVRFTCGVLCVFSDGSTMTGQSVDGMVEFQPSCVQLVSLFFFSIREVPDLVKGNGRRNARSTCLTFVLEAAKPAASADRLRAMDRPSEVPGRCHNCLWVDTVLGSSHDLSASPLKKVQAQPWMRDLCRSSPVGVERHRDENSPHELCSLAFEFFVRR